MKITVGIQARLSSTRLPKKVLASIGYRPMLSHVWENCFGPWKRVVFTSTEPSDDDLCSYLALSEMDYIRGSLEDVLSRYTNYAAHKTPDVLVRVCGDAPFIRAKWIAAAVAAAKGTGIAFVPGVLHAGTYKAWERCQRECGLEDIEHAGHDWFKKHGTHLDLAPSDYFTVNTEEDLLKARQRWEETLALSGE